MATPTSALLPGDVIRIHPRMVLPCDVVLITVSAVEYSKRAPQHSEDSRAGWYPLQS
jgi:hypothetical protein